MSQIPFTSDGAFIDVFLESTESLAVTWRDGSASVERGFRSGAGGRWVRGDGGIGRRSFDGDSRERIDGFFGRSSSLLEKRPSESVGVSPRMNGTPSVLDPGPPGWSGRNGPRDAVADRSPSDERDLVAYLEEASAGVEAALRGVDGIVEIFGRAQAYAQRIRVGNPDGQRTDDRGGVRIDLMARSARARLQRRVADRTLDALRRRVPPQEWGAALGRLLVDRGHALAHPHGDLTVIFGGPECGALFHELGHLFEDPLCAEAGPLGEMGERIGPENLTLVDDPSACTGRGSYSRDDEGIKPRSVTLIEGGRLAERLHRGGDRDGALSEADSSRPPISLRGHTRRATYQDPPLPRMACTFLAAGDSDPGAILESTSQGLFIESLRSGRIDPVSGRILLVASEGWMIERGRKTRPIAESLLVSDARALLASIDAIGNDLTFDHGAGTCVKQEQSLPVMVGLPTVRIRVIRVVAP